VTSALVKEEVTDERTKKCEVLTEDRDSVLCRLLWLGILNAKYYNYNNKCFFSASLS